MKLSQNGIKRLKELEGLRTEPYQDTAAHWTIGYGHKLSPADMDNGAVKIGVQNVTWENFTHLEAHKLLLQDVQRFEKYVEMAVIVPLKQHQFDALVIFAFNVGTAAVNGSTLLKKLNRGAYSEIPAQLKRWVKSRPPGGGDPVTIPGLVYRRDQEVAIWRGQA